MFNPINIFSIVVSCILMAGLWYLKEKIIPEKILAEQKKQQFSTTLKRIKGLERSRIWADRLICLSLGLLLYGLLMAVLYPFQEKLLDIASSVLK